MTRLTSIQLNNLIKLKKGFMSKVFGNLIFQIIVVIIVFQVVTSNKNILDHTKKYKLLYIILYFIVALVFIFAPMSVPAKLVLFTIISVLSGILFTRFENVDKSVIQEAMLYVLGIFISMFVCGLISVYFGVNLMWLGAALFFALLSLITVRIVEYFRTDKSKYRQRLFSYIGIIIFTLFILYDTNNILQRDYDQDFVTASFDYFLDIINLFSNIVNLDD
jgi:FtsH-binding integral membrane protein